MVLVASCHGTFDGTSTQLAAHLSIRFISAACRRIYPHGKIPYITMSGARMRTAKSFPSISVVCTIKMPANYRYSVCILEAHYLTITGHV